MINIPWEERPAGCKDPMWRYSKNPVIPRNLLPDSNSIFNSAVVPFEGGFAGVFRVDDKNRRMTLHAGFSKDGFNWNLEPDPIKFDGDYGYDPRVTFIEDKYYITWCNGYHGPTIGLAWTEDFKNFHQMENAFLPYNRNGVLFPRKIGGRFAMLSRPSDTGHTAFGDIFYSESPDLEFWGRHRFVFGTFRDNASAWQSTKVGPGPAPIETDEGWLLFYHGVLRSCNGYNYSFGAALLDLNDPARVIARSHDYLIAPREIYECVGDTPNVCFPCAALTDADTGRIAIYYGCADTCTGLCFTTLDAVLEDIR